MKDAVSALLNIPCSKHAPRGTADDCSVCGTPVAVYRELERLRDERDQALIRAEAAEAELDAYRRAEELAEAIRGDERAQSAGRRAS